MKEPPQQPNESRVRVRSRFGKRVLVKKFEICILFHCEDISTILIN